MNCAFLVALIVLIAPCFALQEKFVPTENGVLFCQTEGSGKPLIIIHGGAGYLTQDYLLPHMEALGKKYWITLYDQRGLGKSTGEITSDQINLKTYVDDIESIRKSLGVNKISLMGHSFGGLLAMLYAGSYPESTDRLILTNSMVVTNDDIGAFFAELSKRVSPFQKEIDALEKSPKFLAGDPKIVREVSKLYFQTYLHNPALIDKLNLWKTQKENVNGAKVWGIFKADLFMKPFDFLAELRTIQCPTLVIHGADDVIPLISSEHIHNAIPNSSLVEIEQCGHFPFVEQPEVFFKAVEDFLDKAAH